MRNVLDSCSATLQKAKLQQPRRYDDSTQYYDRPHPANAPKWSYVEQPDINFDTDFGELSVEVNVRKVTVGCSAVSGIDNTEKDNSDLMMDDV